MLILFFFKVLNVCLQIFIALHFGFVCGLFTTNSEQKARDLAIALAICDLFGTLIISFIIPLRSYGDENIKYFIKASLLEYWIPLPILLLIGAVLGIIEAIFRHKNLLIMWNDVYASRQTSLHNEFIEDIQILEKVGSGSFGEVLKGIYDGTEVALKKVNSSNLQDFIGEVTLLKSLRHPNIVSYLGVYRKEANVYYMVFSNFNQTIL